jgi:hypothetical protein
MNLLGIQLNLKAYDEVSGGFLTLPKAYYFMMDHRSPTVAQVILKTSVLTRDTGMLFANKATEKYIYSAEVATQMVSQQYLLNSYGFGAIFGCLIRLDAFQEIEYRTYPKIGELCADITSMIGIFFSFRIILQKYNECCL